jgi:hypothetical protein
MKGWAIDWQRLALFTAMSAVGYGIYWLIWR